VRFFSRLPGKALLLVAAATLAGAVLALLTQSSLFERLFERPALIEREAAGAARLVVPAEKVPKSYSQASTAPPLALLPAHWQGGDDGRRVDTLSELELAQVSAFSFAFLRRWETFPALSTAASARRYRRALAPFLAEGASSVLRREESQAPPQICPFAGSCIVGSSWYAPFPPSGRVVVRSQEQGRLYVTARGFVRYRDPTGSPLDGRLVLREYGLLLEQDGQGRWRVRRAVAATVRA
jgi:hypothetical protein